ncbi:MAG: PilX N-terminal domain-containing pilus assembly protein [Serpentinimonas sp.]|nr:PilX N-terminal domain-containing pilus assembly protein [Serpentinimonas sp.]
MPHRTESARHGVRQHGFVLLTTVILLVVLAAISLTAMRGTLQQERMANNDSDVALARQNAELALRDAERDLLGIDVNGNFCSSETVSCPNERPAGHRPTAPAIAGALSNFWLFNPSSDTPWDELALADGGAGLTVERQGLFSADAHRACAAGVGSRAVWLAADWEERPAGECEADSTLGTISLPTIEYGTFTGATAPPGVPAPRYLMEMLPVAENGGTGSKVVFRITAVGFGRTSTNNRRTAVMLQTIFSPR